MDNKVKILESRIATLERQMRDVFKYLRMDDAQILEMEYQEALDQAAAGNMIAIKEYLKKVNKKAE